MKCTLFECHCIQHESTNLGHYFCVSYRRRDHHFTWPSEPTKFQPFAGQKPVRQFVQFPQCVDNPCTWSFFFSTPLSAAALPLPQLLNSDPSRPPNPQDVPNRRFFITTCNLYFISSVNPRVSAPYKSSAFTVTLTQRLSTGPSFH